MELMEGTSVEYRDDYIDCITAPRSLVPVNIMMIGATIHFVLCLLLFFRCGRAKYGNLPPSFSAGLVPSGFSGDFESSQHLEEHKLQNMEWHSDDCIRILKYLLAIVFSVCAAFQTCLDYKHYAHFASNVHANLEPWQKYQCAVFIFTNSPNALHTVSAVFAFCTAAFLKAFDKAARNALLIFIVGEIVIGILVTPFFASIFTHLIPGVVAYGWIAIFVFAVAIFIFYRMHKHSLQYTRPALYLMCGVFVSMLLFVVLIVVVNNAQIRLYDEHSYLYALTVALTERHGDIYLTSLTNFDEWFTFVWLLL